MASAWFLFGQSTVISQDQILEMIESVIPRDRPVIIIGHGVEVELSVLETLGFVVPPQVTAIVDTRRLAREVLEVPNPSLIMFDSPPLSLCPAAQRRERRKLRAALLLTTRWYSLNNNQGDTAAATAATAEGTAATIALLETVATGPSVEIPNWEEHWEGIRYDATLRWDKRLRKKDKYERLARKREKLALRNAWRQRCQHRRGEKLRAITRLARLVVRLPRGGVDGAGNVPERRGQDPC